MFWKQLFARKTLDVLLAEAAGENRLRRILGPIGLTSLGIGAIIGSGIFVMTGRVAAQDAGPAIVLSFTIAGIGCLFAALCYSEFASMAPVAGSAYTYAYATLGELLAWIIGWDLILEYAMACACVASGWSHYLNEFLRAGFGREYQIPEYLCSDPFSRPDAWLNLPALLIILAVTFILVIGIRESATTNAILVAIKVGVVLFVIFVGAGYVITSNWTSVPVSERIFAEDLTVPNLVVKEVKEGALPKAEAEARIKNLNDQLLKLYANSPSAEQAKQKAQRGEALITLFWEETAKLPEAEAKERADTLTAYVLALTHLERKQKELAKAVEAGQKSQAEADAELQAMRESLKASPLQQLKKTLAQEVAAGKKTKEQADAELEKAETNLRNRGHKEMYLPTTPEERQAAERILAKVEKEAEVQSTHKWGILGLLGLNKTLSNIDDKVRSPFAPYGLAGIVFGASIVFFAYIGFDSISTHSEEAVRPQRDVPIAILASLTICTLLYILVAAVLTGMVPYPDINPKAAVASAFTIRGEEQNSPMLKGASALISTGALAGLTSVLLITFLSQARIFLAMARDKLLPPAIFGAIHPRFRTPHISTMLTGSIIAVVAALTPISKLEEMVNIGTLMAFVIVCAAVLILRFQRPDAERPFRAPVIGIVAPLGIVVNLIMMLFLPLDTWLRLLVWLGIGLCIYFGYGMWHSTIGKELRGEVPSRTDEDGHIQTKVGVPHGHHVTPDRLQS